MDFIMGRTNNNNRICVFLLVLFLTNAWGEEASEPAKEQQQKNDVVIGARLRQSLLSSQNSGNSFLERKRETNFPTETQTPNSHDEAHLAAVPPNRVQVQSHSYRTPPPNRGVQRHPIPFVRLALENQRYNALTNPFFRIFPSPGFNPHLGISPQIPFHPNNAFLASASNPKNLQRPPISNNPTGSPIFISPSNSLFFPHGQNGFQSNQGAQIVMIPLTQFPLILPGGNIGNLAAPLPITPFLNKNDPHNPADPRDSALNDVPHHQIHSNPFPTNDFRLKAEEQPLPGNFGDHVAVPTNAAPFPRIFQSLQFQEGPSSNDRNLQSSDKQTSERKLDGGINHSPLTRRQDRTGRNPSISATNEDQITEQATNDAPVSAFIRKE